MFSMLLLQSKVFRSTVEVCICIVAFEFRVIPVLLNQADDLEYTCHMVVQISSLLRFNAAVDCSHDVGLWRTQKIVVSAMEWRKVDN